MRPKHARIFRLLIVLSILRAGPNDVWGQESYWRRLNGPAAGTVQTLATDGRAVIASVTSSGHLFATSDCGNSWRFMNPRDEKLWAAVGSNRAVFALGSSSRTLWRTTDLGRSWQSAQINTGGATSYTHLWLYGQNVYLGTMSGFHRSSDDGRTWSAVILPGEIVEQLLQVNRHIFVGSSRGIHSSSDDGQTFSFSPLGYITALAERNSIVYAGTGYGQLYRSTDLGASWHSIGFTSGGILYSLVANDSMMLAGTQYSGVLISRDSGKTWISTNMRSQYVYALLQTESCVYAGTRYDGVQVSSDDGFTWRDANLGTMNVEAIAAFDHVLLAAQEYSPAIFRSVDQGDTWSRVAVATPFVFDFAGGDGKLFAGARHGVFVSLDDGESWALGGMQLYGKNVFAVAYANGYLYAGVAGDGVMVSSDNGMHWTVGSGFPLGTFVYDLLDVYGTVFAATEHGVYASSDKGLTWELRRQDGRAMGLGAVDSALFVAGYFDRYTVVRTTDFGRSWTETAKGLLGNPLYMYAFATHGTDIFVGTNKGVFRSTNLGERWTPYSDSLRDGGEWAIALASDDRNLYVGSLESGIWWRPFAPPMMVLRERSVIFRDVEIGTSASHVLDVWNNGASPMAFRRIIVSNPRFAAHYHGSPIVPPGSYARITITFSPTRIGEERALLVLKTDAFYSIDTVQVTGLSRSGNVIRALGGVPQDYYVGQNFPNPFNASTTLRFGLPYKDFVQIHVFDVTGSRVAQILDEHLPPGHYEIRWDASTLSSGMYFLRFSSLGYIATRKLVYLK